MPNVKLTASETLLIQLIKINDTQAEIAQSLQGIEMELAETLEEMAGFLHNISQVLTAWWKSDFGKETK